MTMGSGSPILIGVALAQRLGFGGHAWFVLQWLLGLRRLGFEPVLVDRTVGLERDAPAQMAWVRSVLEPFGFEDAWSVDLGGGERVGLNLAELVARARASPFLLNVMGFANDDEVLAAAPERVFLDIDPGFAQLWSELGLADPFVGHDRFVTVGTAINDPESAIPLCGREWLTTLPPVVLEHCPIRPLPAGERLTTVASWRGPFGPIQSQGRTYGLRVHEFRRFLELPGRTGRAFEMALDIDPAEGNDLRLLTEHGWRLVETAGAAGDVHLYRGFIASSSAEFQVAKNLYVQTRGGWFSDRSATYLAMGRPVIAQETRFSAHLPAGHGLLSYSTIEEAVDAVRMVFDDPATHSRCARALAEGHLDSDIVIGDLLVRITR